MDFRAELQALLDQVPRRHVVRLRDLARALGDVRATAAVARFLRDEPLPGGERVVTEAGRPIRGRRGRVPESTRGTAASSPPIFSAFAGPFPLATLRREQARLSAKVSRRNGFRTVRTVAAVDLAYGDGQGFAALVVLRVSDLDVVEEVLISRKVDFPYIPTYLAYREFPLIEAAFRRLSEPPTVLLIDGHGQLHPRRCGIACMAGVKLGVPTIGVAKSPLVGTSDWGPKIGEAVPVRYEGEILGYALRPTASIRPLYVSTGHQISPRFAVRIVRGLCIHRIPEPLRLADARAARWKEDKEKRL